MGAKKKAKKAEKKARKAARAAYGDLPIGGTPKQKKPPKNGAIKRELRRVFGKKLRPDIDITEFTATIAFDGITKLGEDNVRRMLMQVLESAASAT